MSKQESSPPKTGRNPPESNNMTTTPSVGRFSNDQSASLYVKGSLAKFNVNDGRKSMAPYSNHGQLPQQSSQQPALGIVDLRTPSGAELMKPAKPTHNSTQRHCSWYGQN